MTQISLIIRTVAAMMVIFASGVWVGHTLFPRETVVEIPVSVTNGVQKEELPPRPPGRPNARGPRIAGHYRKTLNLDAKQFEKFLPMLREQQASVADLPLLSKERVESIRKFHEKIRPLLRQEQQAGLDQIMREVEEKSAR